MNKEEDSVHLKINKKKKKNHRNLQIKNLYILIFNTQDKLMKIFKL